ncbi:MAG: C_GCAxxG_C_C family protein [Akkermansiaceae bacterium]|nr:C_GCAxxG_C_C family protein [Akkermansiaceae bacterium]
MNGTAAERALAFFHQGFNCAQSVFAAFAPEMALSTEQALRFSAGFGAGVGRMRGMCGAFSGLTMVAGFCKGNLTGEPQEKEVVFSLVRELADAFKEEFGTLTCRELLHLDANVQESARPNERTKAYYDARPCERCVAFCAEKAAELLKNL